MSSQFTFFANCPKLLEGLLAAELTEFGATQVQETLSGVYFTGTLETAYRACLWSRLANHILLPLATIEVNDKTSLYRGVQSIDCSSHFSIHATFKVDFSGQSTVINNTQYGSQLVKDGIVDQFRAQTGMRPQVATTQPDIYINAHLFGDKLTLSIDLSGESLHKRGYRSSQGAAPLKENLAAALLLRANWHNRFSEWAYLIDPMCGSGTLLIEGALIAQDCAPGLFRYKFGFTHWLQHDSECWTKLVDEAKQRHQQGKARPLPDIRGYDASPRAVSQARENIERAGLKEFIDISVRELSDLTPPTHKGNKPGLLISNPPYGERLGDTDALKPLYQHLGTRLREAFPDWEVALLTGNPELGKTMGLRARKNYAFWNGTIACKLLLISVTPEWFVNRAPAQIPSAENTPMELPAEAEMFANRLRKNFNGLKSWVKENDIHCYRVYDADMPEYAVAIDCYEGWAHVQEYAAPKTVAAEKAAHRLSIIRQAIPFVLGIPLERIVMKERREQKDHSQYQKMNDQGNYLTVKEGQCKLLVNMTDYLDTGLFLDHRLMRLRLAEISQGKRVLNLYCYTGTVTVHAALGGAYRTVSVDMSATYTAWARRNLALNGLSDSLHRVIQADCMRWLEQNTEQFDIIFLDPPTFSRSKRMQHDFDVQRDHVMLIRKVLKHLAPNGVLYFSNNFRKFKLDAEALSDLNVQDITSKTIDKDFMRDQKIHHCFEIRR
jgi:23S rRNA (guanine2445-N2)-methyltransferase / 23S rRNA (guanine2069-N7)-methyltransferase